MSAHFHTLKTDELSVIVGDNTAHKQHVAGYNGIWQISSVHDARPVYVPRVSGMNLEFFAPFSKTVEVEPRKHPVDLIVHEPARHVTLHQAPSPVAKVESWIDYQVAGPCHIDWTYRYKLHAPEHFDTGYAGFFFASYIHWPDNKAIYVISPDFFRALMWIQYCPPTQGKDSAITWVDDSYDLTFEPLDHGLYSSRAPLRYEIPLFLGRLGDMALAVMFENPQGVVICYGMTGGSFVENQSDRNPAWDFMLYTKNPSENPTGQWRARVVYKKFVSREDILLEYQQFQNSLGHKWDLPRFGPLQKQG